MGKGQIKESEIRFNCQLSKEDLIKLGNIAKEECRTRNNLIRKILMDYIKEYELKNRR